MKQAIYKTQRKGILMLYFRELRRATLSLKKLQDIQSLRKNQ